MLFQSCKANLHLPWKLVLCSIRGQVCLPRLSPTAGSMTALLEGRASASTLPFPPAEIFTALTAEFLLRRKLPAGRRGSQKVSPQQVKEVVDAGQMYICMHTHTYTHMHTHIHTCPNCRCYTVYTKRVIFSDLYLSTMVREKMQITIMDSDVPLLAFLKRIF